MIISKLQGGLGNQMFQFAAGYALARKYNVPLKLDTSFLLDRTPRQNFVYREYCLDLFALDVNFASGDECLSFGKFRRVSRVLHQIKYICGAARTQYLRENPFRFDHRLSTASADCYLEGFWQSEMYFADVANEIRECFRFRSDLTPSALALANEIERSESVCLNVRRTDFVKNAAANAHHGVCGNEYFAAAAEKIGRAIQNPHFYVFSDDLGWCRENIRVDNMTIVEHVQAGDRFGQYLRLMSLCKHFIIPNSSFGWWAAWLSTHNGKLVTAPRRWYANDRMDTSKLLPKEWTTL